MNTLDDLNREFTRLEAQAPSISGFGADLAVRRARREKRRRTAALVAVAASVVLIAGGVSVTAAMLKAGPGTARPAAPSPVVAVPDIPLPAGSQLVRITLPSVESPVTVTPPKGLTGVTWIQSPGRLAVSFYNPATEGTPDDSHTAYAGYVITTSAEDPMHLPGSADAGNVDVQHQSIEVGGHDATLDSAPPDSIDFLGFPAAQRVSWKLSDGRYIHVWATDGTGHTAFGWTSYSPLASAPPSTSEAATSAGGAPRLDEFAATVIEKPTQLYRTLGVGLTLPGLTHAWSTNADWVISASAMPTWLCPAGVDPYAAQAAGSTAGATSDPAGQCVRVGIVSSDIAVHADGPAEVFTVAGTQVSVYPDLHVAIAPLRDGLSVIAGTMADVSTEDLAYLAASVRLSPDVRVTPANASAGLQSAAPNASSSSVVASSPASTLPLPPGEASIASGAGLAAGGDGSSSAVATSSTGASVSTDTPVRFIPSSIDRGFGWISDTDHRKVTLDFSIQNITDEPVAITSLRLDAQRLHQTSAQVSLDAPDPTMSSLSLPFHAVPLPATVPPRSNAQLRFTFDLTACTPVTDSHPPLVVGWRAADGAGDADVPLMHSDNPGWVVDVTSDLCR